MLQKRECVKKILNEELASLIYVFGTSDQREDWNEVGRWWGWEGGTIAGPTSYGNKFVFYFKWKEKSLKSFKQFLTQIIILFVLIKY